MRSESVRGLILGLVLVAGCKPEPHRPDAAPPWWKPVPGEAADWDIQLAASPFDVSAQRAMYTLDLWDVVPTATTIDYSDGMPPLAVPAGAHASAIADLHTRTPPAIVVCQIGVGSIRLTDPDAKKFPIYEASPPNRQTAPAAGSVIGWSTTTADANERFIDIHQAARTIITPLIKKRIDLAQTIGCDAIAAKDSDVPAFQDPGGIGHGFPDISFSEYESWTGVVAGYAHSLRISVGPHNRSTLAVDQMAVTHDWIIAERCAEFQECDMYQPFLNRSKAVFALEYNKNEAGMDNNPTTLCGRLETARIQDGIIKDAALSSAVYVPCSAQP